MKRVGWVFLAVAGLLLGGSAITNVFLVDRSQEPSRLTDLDKSHIAEFLHLRRVFGDSLWGGWSNAKIAVILNNEEYVFLVGINNPSPGWRTVPQDLPRGGAWEVVPQDSFEGEAYYRQRLVDGGISPPSFTVRVGEIWAASMTTKGYMALKMGNNIRDGLAPLFRPVVPYRLIARIFLGLAMNTDAYICALGHEGFHAFQGSVAPRRLAAAERELARLGKRYPWDEPLFAAAWKAELNALADALVTGDEKVMIERAREFLSLRRDRRLSKGFDSAMANLERLREWEEGLGKYTELSLWKMAAADSSYNPAHALWNDPDFNRYKTFRRQWAQEISTLRLQSHGGETRFYYSGMAQALLLDRLSPRWRTLILQDNLSLEDMLEAALVPL